ncbi:hypothetical protein [Subtercola lobariae]|uniref:ACT domain-containing protein n=1 Tax=Subtercola lobariae TaxID=1588641 RepID=A0A917F1L8_9MICO|nr:hypothetical protein [Subtercola lobariae]GGF41399.1 hypothetical protein GCM10011399_37590 [Subtercola lobariae]
MSSIEDRWIVFVSMTDRSGALSALTETFSSRGVSFESLNTLDVFGGVGQISITFRGSESIARVLMRTLERLAVTRSVLLTRADDPALHAVAVIAGHVEGFTVALDAPGDFEVAVGSLVRVEQAVAAARAAGQAIQAVAIVPPV